MARQYILALAAFFSLASAAVKCPGTANYTLTFRALWKLDRHPKTNLPGNAHFTALVGCSHGPDYVMWRAGTKATPGVELVAETGGTSTLVTEIKDQIAAKKAWKLISASGAGAEEVVTGIGVQVTADFSKVSLITMLAPSPDWFIGVDSLDMCDNGTWRQSLDVTMLPPWDAGTEEGQAFTLGNAATDPKVDIFQITNNTDGAFKNDQPIKSLGEFLFKGIGLPVIPDASSTVTASSSTPAPPMDKSTTTATPTDNAVAMSSVGFTVLVSVAMILILLF